MGLEIRTVDAGVVEIRVGRSWLGGLRRRPLWVLALCGLLVVLFGVGVGALGAVALACIALPVVGRLPRRPVLLRLSPGHLHIEQPRAAGGPAVWGFDRAAARLKGERGADGALRSVVVLPDSGPPVRLEGLRLTDDELTELQDRVAGRPSAAVYDGLVIEGDAGEARVRLQHRPRALVAKLARELAVAGGLLLLGAAATRPLFGPGAGTWIVGLLLALALFVFGALLPRVRAGQLTVRAGEVAWDGGAGWLGRPRRARLPLAAVEMEVRDAGRLTRHVHRTVWLRSPGQPPVRLVGVIASSRALERVVAAIEAARDEARARQGAGRGELPSALRALRDADSTGG